jgi:hypothetical protein
MWILVAVATIVFIGANAFTLWFDHTTSGKYKKGYGDVVSCIVALIVLVWGFSDSLVEISPLLAMLALSAVIRSISYAWYCGPLKCFCCRRIEKLREKWQVRLEEVEVQLDVLEQTEKMSDLISPKLLREAIQGTSLKSIKPLGVKFQKEKICLEWKLKHIVP